MDEDLSTESDFKQTFKSAIEDYDNRIATALLIAAVFFIVPMLVITFISIQYRSAIDDFTMAEILWKFGPESLVGLIFIFGFILSCVFSSICFYKQCKRFKENSALNCPHCRSSLVSDGFRRTVFMTGYCPDCLEKLFEGELVSESAAIEYYAKTKSELKHSIRFTFGVSLAGLLSGLLIYHFAKPIADAVDGHIINPWGLPVIFLFLPVMIWLSSKFIFRACQSDIKLFQKVKNKNGSLIRENC